MPAGMAEARGMSLCEVKVEIVHSMAEVADQLLLEEGAGSWSVLEDVIARRAWVQAICADEVEAGGQWSRLRPQLEGAGVVFVGEAEYRELADADWRDSYKAHFKASRFGRLHWVPEWERRSYVLPEGDVVLWLDPGLAFGTGNHETTRLCCERLAALAEERSGLGALSVLDAGCGSGILALSAVLLGFGHVAGFDNDTEAVRISGENAVLNGLEGRVEFYEGDLVTGLAGREADVLMANILADVLIRYSRNLLAAVAPGGTLILSGILAQECEAVRVHFAAQAPGWALSTRTMGEWSDVCLRRRSEE